MQLPGTYQARTGKTYHYRGEGGDWDLDHPAACLFTFLVAGPERSFEKVIAVDPEEVGEMPVGERYEAAFRAAETKLFRKLDQDNEADEPTPLR